MTKPLIVGDEQAISPEAEDAKPLGRCPICDWPFAASREFGCVPGDCCNWLGDPAEQEAPTTI